MKWLCSKVNLLAILLTHYGSLYCNNWERGKRLILFFALVHYVKAQLSLLSYKFDILAELPEEKNSFELASLGLFNFIGNENKIFEK